MRMAVVRSPVTGLYERRWDVPDCRAVVVMLHGVQSHSGWYVGSATYLARSGIAVVAPDRRGSGLNSENRGDAPNYRVLLGDVGETVLRAQRSFPGRPVHLLGISWGGKLTAAWAARHAHLLRSIILVTPGLFPQVDLSRAEKLAVLFWRFWEPKRLFPIPLSDPRLFTANPERVRYIETDPLALHRATARFLVGSRNLDLANAGVESRLRLPVLLFLAGQDRIVDNEKLGSFFDGLSGEGNRLVEYGDAHHTLEFEPEPEPFFAELRRWILDMS